MTTYSNYHSGKSPVALAMENVAKYVAMMPQEIENDLADAENTIIMMFWNGLKDSEKACYEVWDEVAEMALSLLEVRSAAKKFKKALAKFGNDTVSLATVKKLCAQYAIHNAQNNIID